MIRPTPSLNTLALATLLQLLLCGARMSCAGADDTLDKAILDFPDLRVEKYRPDLAVQSANVLIAAGQTATCQALARAAAVKSDEGQETELSKDKVCHLCRLLFVATNSPEPLRRPRLGSMAGLPYMSMPETNWPDLPFAITNGVVISLHLGYTLAGMAEHPVQYLSYCQANGVVRTNLFPTPTFLSVSNALSEILTSPQWKALQWKYEGEGFGYTYDADSTQERLWKQLANMNKLHFIAH
jgi:hypothetical protein